MPAAVMILDLSGGRAPSGWRQPLAGRTLWSSFPLGEGSRPAPRPGHGSGSREPDGPWRLVYDGPGELDGSVSRIRSWIGAQGARRLEFEDGERFEIDPDGGCVTLRTDGRDAGNRSQARALAAPLTLALALQRTFLLHAGAVAGSSGVLALVAPSGGGKSTLARAAPAAGLRLVADDQLPAHLAETPRALPHYPQLKLPPAEAWPAASPPELPLAALVEIAGDPGRTGVDLVPLDASEAFVALTRAGVGLRLFDPELLAAHFEAAAAASRALPAFRLHLPWRRDRLGEAVAVLAELDRRLGAASQVL